MPEDTNLDMTNETGADTGDFEELFAMEPDAPDAPETAGEEAAEKAEPPPPADQPEAGGNEAGEKPKAQEDPEKVEISFLGEKRSVTMAELKALAQKGMNYDHAVSAAQRENAVLDRYALASGKTRQQVLQELDKQLYDFEIAKYTQGGVSKEIAERIVALEADNRKRQMAEQKAVEDAKKREQFELLIREYPDLKSIPEEVTAEITKGETPLSAYRAWENRQLKAKLAAREQAEKTKAKNPGSVAADAPEAPADDFLAGFGF